MPLGVDFAFLTSGSPLIKGAPPSDGPGIFIPSDPNSKDRSSSFDNGLEKEDNEASTRNLLKEYIELYYLENNGQMMYYHTWLTKLILD